MSKNIRIQIESNKHTVSPSKPKINEWFIPTVIHHKPRYSYTAIILISDRLYAEETESFPSRYQAMKAAKRIIKDSYTEGGKDWVTCLEYNRIDHDSNKLLRQRI